MDTDWCLTCSKHIHNGASPYCSSECRFRAGPSRLPSYEDIQAHISDDEPSEFDLAADDEIIDEAADDDHVYTSHHYAGIEAWAAAIPAGASAHFPPPSRPPSAKSSRTPSIASFSTRCSPTSVSTVVYRPPNLLKPHRAVPATLCMSKASPKPSSPSLPIITPQQQLGGRTSPESSLATPASSKALQFGERNRSSSSGVLKGIASHVRSWVAPSPLSALPQHHHLEKGSRFPDEYSDDDEGTPIFIAQVAPKSSGTAYWAQAEEYLVHP
ncbi:hypothetical protein BKA70DRAFT_1368430 [Coprinopsis sp. MPI-PUGE-AT-0042]|nr:hypothetical protein BKA70DRAFT_1368430 [Coprinopsis sp. MPI-PUGE-AT-0042]